MLQQQADAKADILDTNSRAMHMCQSGEFQEAYEALEHIYLRLQTDTSFEDPTVLEQLKATTFTNLGVVQSHLGDQAKAIEHLEAAHSIEARSGKPSACTLLNLCAAYNAVGEYERAAECARWGVALLFEGGEVNDDNKMLWGAAWHNLGVAEMNLRRGSDEDGVILATFQNALAASVDLLGRDHPMTLAVHGSFRDVRKALKSGGSFVPHRSVTSRQQRQRLLPTSVSNQPALPPLIPYSGRSPLGSGISQTARESLRSSSSTKRSKVQPLPLFHPENPARNASQRVYRTSHPLFQKHPNRESRSRESILSPAKRIVTETKPAKVPAPPRAPPSSLPGAPKPRRLSELLLSDMWVELEVPRPATGSPKDPQGRPGVRPSYGQAEHVIDPSDVVADNVADPASHARPLAANAALAEALGPDVEQYSGISVLLSAGQ